MRDRETQRNSFIPSHPLSVQMRSPTLYVLKGWGDTERWLPRGNVAQEGGGRPRTPLGQPDCGKKAGFLGTCISHATEDCQRPPLLSGNLQALTCLHSISIFSLVKSHHLLCIAAPLEGYDGSTRPCCTERTGQWPKPRGQCGPQGRSMACCP